MPGTGELQLSGPQVRLRFPVTITRRLAGGDDQSEEMTLDMSATGACVLVKRPLPVGTVVDFAVQGHPVQTRAIVRSVYRERLTGVSVVGIEFLDLDLPFMSWLDEQRRNELPVWQGPTGPLAVGLDAGGPSEEVCGAVGTDVRQ